MKLTGLILALFFISNTAFSKTTIIHAGLVIDGINNKPLTKQSIFVVDDKIISIESGFKQSKDAEIIDLKDQTVMPGFMDMHTHLSVTFSKKTYLEGFTLNEGDYAVHAVASARKTLMAGFTTVRDLGEWKNSVSAVKKAIRQGKVIGPRIYSAGKAIATTGGHADPTNGHRFDEMDFPGPKRGVVNSPSEARAAVRQRYKEGAELIKITATGGVLSPAKSGQNPQFMMDELKSIIKTAKDYGFTVAAHAHGKEGMLRAIKAGVSSIEHGTFLDNEVAAQMKKYGTYYVPTIMAGNWVAEKSKIDGFFPDVVRPKAAKIGPLIQGAFSKAYKKGVKIAFGTDSGVSKHGLNAQEFELMVNAGMPPMKAIQSATIEAAKLLRIQKQGGSITKGKWADIVAVKGNPLKDIKLLQNVSFVMKAGIVYKK